MRSGRRSGSARGIAERPTASASQSSGLRVVAVDWSGEVSGGRKTIWLAEVVGGELVRLENGRTRAELTDELIRMASSHREFVIGLDFAFSFPEWFLDACRVSDARDLWRQVERHGERWLQGCESPFWGRPGKGNPKVADQFRKTELASRTRASRQPKSVFQIGGAGAVGTGSIRGMPQLARLHDAGFSIWPFDEPALPTVIEIYPRLLTGPVVKSNLEARREYLDVRYPGVPAVVRTRAAQTEDAFDAAVSALVMWNHRTELSNLAATDNPVFRREGAIWFPAES